MLHLIHQLISRRPMVKWIQPKSTMVSVNFVRNIHNWLVVTGTWLLFSHSVGNVIIPNDSHIFQRGSNHLPDKINSLQFCLNAHVFIVRTNHQFWWNSWTHLTVNTRPDYLWETLNDPIPKCSMYGNFTHISPKNSPNVHESSIHGAYGIYIYIYM